MQEWNLLLDVVVLLAGCLALGGLLSRLGQSPLIGYLLAGMFLGGPGSLRLVESREEIDFLSELGVSLLLFSIGLEFSIARLKSLGGRVLVAGVLQVAVTLALVAGLCLAAGLGPKPSLAVGAMVSLSSTAVVLRILMERGELESPYGANSLGILLVQDMAVVPLALLVAFLARADGAQATNSVWAVLGGALGLVFGLYALLHHVAVWALSSLSNARNRELVILLAIVSVLGSAWAAHAVGVSPALGTFLAGMLLGGSPFATQVRADVAPARILLLTLFFGTAGMIADPIWIGNNIGVVLLSGAGVVLVKLIVVTAILRIQRQTPVSALSTGLVLAQVGEFAFVLANVAREGALLDPYVDQLAISVTILSMVIGAAVVPFAPGLASRLTRFLLRVESARRTPLAGSEHAPEAIVIGFGPAGRASARACQECGLRTLVIDLNARSLAAAHQQGYQVLFGDATQVEVLEHAEVSAAIAVVVTIPHVPSAAAIVENVRGLAPLAQVLVRCRYQRDTSILEHVGAHLIVGDEEQVGVRLAEEFRAWRRAGEAARVEQERGSEPEGDPKDRARSPSGAG